jgi:hypothetical protein
VQEGGYVSPWTMDKTEVNAHRAKFLGETSASRPGKFELSTWGSRLLTTLNPRGDGGHQALVIDHGLLNLHATHVSTRQSSSR